jgi:hypothetical protein
MLLATLALAPVTGSTQQETRKMQDSNTIEAAALMAAFAERTGLTSARPAQRYLWTDAFAVCNLLGLADATGEMRYRDLALRLVDQVHHTLGRHRSDDPRRGWISGLDEAGGETHPTRGGLRIGKRLPERTAEQPYDERLEWDRDGQYFHYLTKWMHALDQVARTTGQAHFSLWARELAASAQRAFTFQPDRGTARMHWKMSIDLSRSLVASMGQHDPLDGYVTCLQLRATAARLAGAAGGPALDEAVSRFAAMSQGGDWATDDPLGIGGLLVDAYRVEQLRRQGALPDEQLAEKLLAAALAGLHRYATSAQWRLPAQYRLAFRELGLAIGLHAVERMHQAAGRRQPASARDTEASALLHALLRHVGIGKEIESYWRDPGHRRSPTWSEHRDINEVMLATSLAPEGYLVLRPPQ